MTDNLVPDRVWEFLARNIDSIAELEALLLLRGDPQTDWTVPALAQRLYTTPAQTEEAVAKLRSLKLLEAGTGSTASYHYRAATADLDAAVGEVAETYSKYLIAVTNLIHSKQHSRVQEFADAFKLRNRRDEK